MNWKTSFLELKPGTARVLQHDPTNLRALASQGRIFLITKHYSEAVKTFNEIKRLGKSEPDTPLKIGLLYFEQKYYDDAIREFREFLISQKGGRTRRDSFWPQPWKKRATQAPLSENMNKSAAGRKAIFRPV